MRRRALANDPGCLGVAWRKVGRDPQPAPCQWNSQANAYLVVVAQAYGRLRRKGRARLLVGRCK